VSRSPPTPAAAQRAPEQQAETHQPATPSRQEALDAKERGIRALLAEHGVENEFHVIQSEPFIVIGDDSRRKVQRSVDRTISYSVARLKRRYNFRDPAEVLEVWLFRNERSYRKYTRLLLDDDPDTPYGYYSPSRGALVMNIGTGGGTLIHEIVHPYIETNFPDCPAWFNEGLGSLYEASEYRGEHIFGVTNWRLPGLQKAIRRGGLTTFADLTATTDSAFYRDDAGTNYAQARYLLYYLQQEGLLDQYYRSFLAARRDDPTGYDTLVETLGRHEMEAFQDEWERWVLRLTWR